MSSHGIRLGGWLLLIGGLLSAVTILLPYLIVGPGGPGGVPVVPINVLSIIGALLLIGGLPAFYACQAKQTGWVGLVGVVALGMTELLLVVLRFFLPNLVGTVLLSISDLLYYLSIARIGWLLITQFANAAAKPPLSSLETTE